MIFINDYIIKQNVFCYIKHLDVLSQASWARRSEASTRSHISDRASLISSVPGGPDNNEKLTPQQYGVLGKFLMKFIINNSDIFYIKK